MQLNSSTALRVPGPSRSAAAPTRSSIAPRTVVFPAAPAGAAALSYRRKVTVMGNKATGGPFAPLVRVVRNVMGTKEFNKFRGQAISLHSQIIKDFGKQIGADGKQVQGLIRLAKKNGEKLGFLA